MTDTNNHGKEKKQHSTASIDADAQEEVRIVEHDASEDKKYIVGKATEKTLSTLLHLKAKERSQLLTFLDNEGKRKYSYFNNRQILYFIIFMTIIFLAFGVIFYVLWTGGEIPWAAIIDRLGYIGVGGISTVIIQRVIHRKR